MSNIKTLLIGVMMTMAGTANAGWVTSVSKDEMTGDKSCYAHSSLLGPRKRMKSPYGNVTARLLYGTSPNRHQWMYVYFTESPNLRGGDIRDGYHIHKMRVKFEPEGNTMTNEFSQEWGDRFIGFHKWDGAAINLVQRKNKMILELDWYGQGKVIFPFFLEGSSKAIAEARAKCGY